MGTEDKSVAVATAQLATATGTGKEVTLRDGTVVVIKPLKFKQTVKTLQMLPPLMDLFKRFSADTSVEDIELADLLRIAPDCLMQIGLMCLNKPADDAFFDELETEEALDVFTAVWEVNQDFFSKSVLPRLNTLGTGAVVERLKQLGSNVSTS